MAVLKVSQIGPGRAAEGKSDHNRSYTVPFEVIVSSGRDGGGTVGNAVDPNTGVQIPARFAPYIGYEGGFSDPNALCTKVTPKQEGGTDWQKWLVEALFETNYQIQQQPDPSQDEVLKWIEFEREKRKVTKEWNGTPIVNTSGQLLNGLERYFTSLTYCFLRNELSITNKLQSYNDTTNSDSFYGMSPYQGLLTITVDKQQRRNQYVYWPHTYKVRFKKDYWVDDPVDRGTMVRVTVGGATQLARPMQDNQPIDGEVNLDGHGKMLADGAALVYLGQINGASSKKLYEPKAFAALNL